jgi:hypothetical protein
MPVRWSVDEHHGVVAAALESVVGTFTPPAL